jgi:hypothetical protein
MGHRSENGAPAPLLGARPAQVVHLRPLAVQGGVQEMAPLLFQRVALSQFKVARYLVQHPQALVMQEHLFSDLTPTAYRREAQKPEPNRAIEAQTVFPSGIPTVFNQLSESQKQFLGNEGAAAALFFLGALTQVHAELRGEDLKRMQAALAPFLGAPTHGPTLTDLLQSNPRLRLLFNKQRQDALLRRLKALGQRASQLGQAVVLIHGGDPAFAREMAREPGFRYSVIDMQPAAPAGIRGLPFKI